MANKTITLLEPTISEIASISIFYSDGVLSHVDVYINVKSDNQEQMNSLQHVQINGDEAKVLLSQQGIDIEVAREKVIAAVLTELKFNAKVDAIVVDPIEEIKL